jgi:hypothetical protein
MDYIAWSDDDILFEPFLVEVAGGIDGRGTTKTEADENKLVATMKDSLDFYRDFIHPKDDEWEKYCTYSLAVNGKCLIPFRSLIIY